MAEAEPFLPVESAPGYGDIVWGRFPESIGQPGPKCRPMLVLATMVNTNKTATYATIQVAYGTSKLKTDRAFTKFHLSIQNASKLAKFRLPQATRFDLDHIIWLPWSSRWVEPREEGLTPIIGKLDDEYRETLKLLKMVRGFRDQQKTD